jgi:hypothetical protein
MRARLCETTSIFASMLLLSSMVGCVVSDDGSPAATVAALGAALAIDDAEERATALSPLVDESAVASLPERGARTGDGVVELLAAGEPIVLATTHDVHHDVGRARIRRGDERGLLMVQTDFGRVVRLAVLYDPIPDDDVRPDALVAYEHAWAETDEVARRAFVDDALALDGRYVDPTADVRGRQGLADHIAGFQGQMPTASIVGTSGILVQHGVLHFTWHMDLVKDTIPFTDGMDVIFLDDGGQLSLVAGFFGPLADDAAAP